MQGEKAWYRAIENVEDPRSFLDGVTPYLDLPGSSRRAPLVRQASDEAPKCW